MKQISIHILNFILLTSLISFSDYPGNISIRTESSNNILDQKATLTRSNSGLRFLKAAKEENSNLLVWRTTKGAAVDHFLIERSEDKNENFEVIHKITPDENNETKNVYEYKDLNYKPTSFYRIKLVDEKGDFQYSETLRVTRMQEKLMIINIHQTDSGSFTVRYKTPENSKNLRLYLSDLKGDIIWSYDLLMPGKNQAITVHTLFYYQGLYQINLSDNKHMTSQKIII